MKKLLYVAPFVAIAAMTSSFALAGECENAVETIDPATAEISMICPDEYSYSAYMSPMPEYDYFQQEYTRISGNLHAAEDDMNAFIVDMKEMTISEKVEVYNLLIQFVSYLRNDIRYLKTSTDTDTDKEKALVAELATAQKALVKTVKDMKKKYEILDYSEYNTIDSVAQSFAVTTEMFVETKELYTLLEADLSEKEKKKAKRALKMADTLYAKLKKQADGIKTAVINRPEGTDTWILQNKYNSADYRVTSLLDRAKDFMMGY